MAENVEYILSLKDLFSDKIRGADMAAKGLSGTMAGIATLAAAGFGLIGGISFLKSSAEAFNEADKAGAQLNATLASTGFAAGRTREQLDAQADALMRVSTFDDDAITGAQSLLLTFTNIRGEILDKTTPAILDLATKMGGDLKGATIQVGKALQDPTHGMLALRKAGISFSEAQQKVIKDMQATGDLAGAQQMILAELNKEFGGSAQADAATYSGQMTILKHEFANVKEEIGGVLGFSSS
jgi:phage-related minor tail protein